MYKLEYLPAALQDLTEIARYISHSLNNPHAANNLSEEIVERVNQLTEAPYANPSYISIKPLTHEYRKLLIKNWLALYWIDEYAKTVTVARIIYAKRNYERLLD